MEDEIVGARDFRYKEQVTKGQTASRTVRVRRGYINGGSSVLAACMSYGSVWSRQQSERGRWHVLMHDRSQFNYRSPTYRFIRFQLREIESGPAAIT